MSQKISKRNEEISEQNMLQDNCFEHNVWHPGNNIWRSSGSVNLTFCRDKCQENNECIGIEYTPSGTCYLKQKFGFPNLRWQGLISWKRACRGKYLDIYLYICSNRL